VSLFWLAIVVNVVAAIETAHDKLWERTTVLAPEGRTVRFVKIQFVST
jgi:hypothetical protein